MRFMIRYRHQITAFIAVALFVLIVYFAIRTNQKQASQVKPDTYDGQVMGTVLKKTIYSDSRQTSDQANALIDATLEELEAQISVRLADSVLSKCNANYAVGGLYSLPEDILDYFKQEMEIYKETKGAFSPCIRPITELWGIEDGKTEIPAEEMIKETLECTDPFNIEVSDEGLTFHSAYMKIDMGAVGKGIACDKVVEELKNAGVQGAVVSVGGSIAVYGVKAIGEDWHIGIQDPRGEYGEYLGVIQTEGNIMISTSGDYEKYFELDGKRYHHIFDPETGYPVDNGLISVTIVSDNGFLSDALSTACFVMGLKKGMAYAKEKGVEAVFVTSDKRVYITDGLEKTFHLKAKGYKLKTVK